MNMKYTFAKTTADLDKIQDKAIKAATNARNLIQLALVATVHHLAVNHDIRVARRLVDGLHETVRGKALVQFLTKYGCLNVGEVDVVGEDGKTSKTTTFTTIQGNADEHAAAIRELFEECKAKMWWTFKAPNPYKGFNLQQYLSNGIKQAQAAAEKIGKGEAEADALSLDVNDTTIRSILALCKFDAILAPANDEAAASEQAA